MCSIWAFQNINTVMTIDVITREDLQRLKAELLEEIRLVVAAKSHTDEKWLRSADVRRMLAISAGTLQNLRIQGLLSYTKLGGSFFYKREDIEMMLSKKK
jgi:hypothetical protein